MHLKIYRNSCIREKWNSWPYKDETQQDDTMISNNNTLQLMMILLYLKNMKKYKDDFQII